MAKTTEDRPKDMEDAKIEGVKIEDGKTTQGETIEMPEQLKKNHPQQKQER